MTASPKFLSCERTQASAWFSFTPLASRRCARKPNWDVTSLSSYTWNQSLLRQIFKFPSRIYLFGHKLHDARWIGEGYVSRITQDSDLTVTSQGRHGIDNRYDKVAAIVCVPSPAALALSILIAGVKRRGGGGAAASP